MEDSQLNLLEDEAQAQDEGLEEDLISKLADCCVIHYSGKCSEFHFYSLYEEIVSPRPLSFERRPIFEITHQQVEELQDGQLKASLLRIRHAAGTGSASSTGSYA